MSIYEPSAFCQFECCKGKNFLLNDAHIFAECQHPPFVQAREKTIAYAREVTTKIINEADYDYLKRDRYDTGQTYREKIVERIQNIGQWWGSSNYESFKISDNAEMVPPSQWAKITNEYFPTDDHEKTEEVRRKPEKNDDDLRNLALAIGLSPEEANRRMNIILEEREYNFRGWKKRRLYLDTNQQESTHQVPIGRTEAAAPVTTKPAKGAKKNVSPQPKKEASISGLRWENTRNVSNSKKIAKPSYWDTTRAFDGDNKRMCSSQKDDDEWLPTKTTKKASAP